MDPTTFALAIVPPSLALLAEFVNPPSRRAIEENARIDFDDFQDEPGFKEHPETFQTLLRTVENYAEGVAAISRLTPTYVSAVTGGFAVAHELPSPFVALLIYVTVFIAIGMSLLYIMMGLSFEQLATESLGARFLSKDIVVRLFGRRVAVLRKDTFLTRTELISMAIYFINGSLTLLWLIIYLMQIEKQS